MLVSVHDRSTGWPSATRSVPAVTSSESSGRREVVAIGGLRRAGREPARERPSARTNDRVRHVVQVVPDGRVDRELDLIGEHAGLAGGRPAEHVGHARRGRHDRVVGGGFLLLVDLVERVGQLVGRAAQERARHVALLLVGRRPEVRRIRRPDSRRRRSWHSLRAGTPIWSYMTPREQPSFAGTTIMCTRHSVSRLVAGLRTVVISACRSAEVQQLVGVDAARHRDVQLILQPP